MDMIANAFQSLNARLDARLDDCQRQIQDLNSLVSSPHRSQSPPRGTRFGTAPHDLYGHPPRRPYEPERRIHEPEYTYTAPNLHRAGTLPATATRSEREVSVVSAPREIAPYRPPGDARIGPAAPKMTIKAPTFSGTDLEDVTVWIWRTEVYLRNIRTPPEDYFSVAMFQVEGDASTFLYDLVRKNNGQMLTWEAFKTSLR